MNFESNFDYVHQMLMQYGIIGMHAIDLGIIIMLIRAILRMLLDIVESNAEHSHIQGGVLQN